MKHVMKSLKHNGIFVPIYDYKGFTIKINGQTIKLTAKSEQMAVAWVRKTLSTVSPPDQVFKHNFMREFLKEIKAENPSATFLNSFIPSYLHNIEHPPTLKAKKPKKKPSPKKSKNNRLKNAKSND